MPADVTVYTTKTCPHCLRAKDLLKRKGIPFREIDLTEDPKAREEAERRFGWMTVPLIVIGGRFIGGADELYALERSGELKQCLRIT